MEQWQNFFTNDYLKFSEEILTDERTNYELNFLLDNLDLKKGAKILDLGCGQGRVSVPLAKCGFEITGLDASSDLLKEAEKRAERELLNIKFVQLDMRDMAFEEEFDAVINMGTAFGYIEEQSEDSKILDKIYTSLKPNGVFIQDLENREAKTNNYNSQTWYTMNNRMVWSKRDFNFITGRWNEVIKWVEDEKENQSVLNLRLYTAAEIVHMNKQAGFDLVESYGFYNNQKYSPQSPRMIMKYKKS
ncbi:class I SAM-dependent methyltransferase [Bacillus sp. SM2101]|uniref:class I SAM-dependent methyltransferase n=1 Tax=Bacillus sp. SM2101 TaxID=2805366 RepID=UPI001BDEEBDE|nr:class I SAM-dependent methyltransferase [Bacillus sp. SM2101]